MIGTKYPEVFAALAAPFGKSEVKSRAGGGGRQLSYITVRVAQNRFDEVLGPENWRNRHRLEHMAGGVDLVVCTIEVKIDGEWVGKEDAGGFKEMTEKNRKGEMVEDEENTVKTAYSDAFKRAATAWGVGRYLYNDGGPIYNFDREEPPPSPSPANGKKPSHPNKSGFDTGQYASPQDTLKYIERIKERVQNVNDQWQEFWIDPRTGEFPGAIKHELMSVFQADGHLVKWAVETGQIDPDALEKNGQARLLGRHAAIVMGRGKAEAAAMKAELGRYFAQVFEDKKAAIYRKHPELSPDGWLEEQQEADDADHGDAWEPSEQDQHDAAEARSNA